MHSLVALPRTFHLSSLQRIESAEPAPGVRRCWLRKLSPVYIDYFCLYCILSGLPAGHIISHIGVGFVVLFAHILPIVKPFFLCFLLCKPSFSLRIAPSLLVPQAMRSTVYVLSFIVSFSLSYSFTLTLLLPFRPSTTRASHGGIYPHIIFIFLSSLILQSREQSAVISISPLVH
ncbi:hypothetical protein DFH94DRAFT_447531 [Russula ochroleuca]|jgi:hypothetical protein|uniref:Uncharacterized protein n=1 Tax=Russula ochroleuca TaxID=152965 RepID=A0A9P5TA31_9AGAM|nr:hypothetical protein DFH94DRAFT_447531 [Russula ochroleuca]